MYHQLAATLPTDWIDNYIAMFEAGLVQKHPHARFVNACGECCIVGALVAARSGRDVVESDAWRHFRGSVLEQLSRAFETGRMTGQDFYEASVLVRAARTAGTVRRAASV